MTLLEACAEDLGHSGGGNTQQGDTGGEQVHARRQEMKASRSKGKGKGNAQQCAWFLLPKTFVSQFLSAPTSRISSEDLT